MSWFIGACYLMVTIGLVVRARYDQEKHRISRPAWRTVPSALVWPFLLGWQLGRMLSTPTTFEMNELSTRAMADAEASLRERSRDDNRKMN